MYDGEVREDDWCSNHACYVWQCPKPKPVAYPPGVDGGAA